MYSTPLCLGPAITAHGSLDPNQEIQNGNSTRFAALNNYSNDLMLWCLWMIIL
jgi:hypothetical protein